MKYVKYEELDGWVRTSDKNCCKVQMTVVPDMQVSDTHCKHEVIKCTVCGNRYQRRLK